ncbi:MAG: PIG-L family deacetylase [Pseudomonas sp.]|nr:PIG-L family deacetylase [Pseudomonas sp.]
MGTKLKILTFGAHPDDIEFGCGGLLIKEIEHGSCVATIICSLGEAGTNGTPSKRKKEALRAALKMGVDVKFLYLGGDCHLQDSVAASFKIAREIRKNKPDIILSPSLSENQHPDHFTLAKLITKAVRLARYGGVAELKKHPPHRVKALYYYSSSIEFDNPPDIIVDVTDQHEKWMSAMMSHKSQLKTKKYIRAVNAKAAFFGVTIDVGFAVGLWKSDPVHITSLTGLK